MNTGCILFLLACFENRQVGLICFRLTKYQSYGQFHTIREIKILRFSCFRRIKNQKIKQWAKIVGKCKK